MNRAAQGRSFRKMEIAFERRELGSKPARNNGKISERKGAPGLVLQ